MSKKNHCELHKDGTFNQEAPGTHITAEMAGACSCDGPAEGPALEGKGNTPVGPGLEGKGNTPVGPGAEGKGNTPTGPAAEGKEIHLAARQNSCGVGTYKGEASGPPGKEPIW